MKPIKGWVVVDDFEEMLWFTFHTKRKDSMQNLTKLESSADDWEFYYTDGYRCIRVMLRED